MDSKTLQTRILKTEFQRGVILSCDANWQIGNLRECRLTQILRKLWLPDVEILNLKEFETHSVLSKLEGIWIDKEHQLMYALATRITFICPMKFNAFPMDIQVCKFQVGK